MKIFWKVLGILVWAFGTNFPAMSADPPEKMRLLVPAYFYPAGKGAKEWERVLEKREEAGVVAVVNPASGPGRQVDANSPKTSSARNSRKSSTPSCSSTSSTSA